MAHYGTQRRDAFRDWVGADMPDQAAVQVYYETVQWPKAKLLDQMAGCTDKMPDVLCDSLKMKHGNTYATAATNLLRTHR